MTALISGDQQSNTLTVAQLVSESCRPGYVRPTLTSPPTPSPVPQKHTPLTQQVLHKLLLPSSPHECTHTHTNLGLGRVAGVSFFSTQVIFNHGWRMRRLFSLWKVLEQHCVFTQLYTLPPCFSSPDLCYHVPGRNLIKWHRAPTISSSLSISHLCLKF